MTAFLIGSALLFVAGVAWLWNEATGLDDGLEDMWQLPARDPEVHS